jgi:hypothetical protein
MDATTMHSTLSLLTKLRSDYPQFTFNEASTFQWSPDTKTISVDSSSDDFAFFTLHELGHALLDHQSYRRDIDLIKIERDAWHFAVHHLAEVYAVTIPEDDIQDNLDTYREWLHARSTCPSCKMTGLQTSESHYSCLACGCRWKSNEARSCALRRYSISQ